MSLNLKPHCIENLKKLRDFLWDNQKKIHVQMQWYGELQLEDYEKPVEALTECGSVGCAIGWAPKVVPVPDDCVINGRIFYGEYAYTEFCELECNTSYAPDTVFKALFGYRWSDSNKDPSTLGVVFRIDTVLKLNEIPDELLLDINRCMEDDELKRMVDAYRNMRAEWLKEQGISE